MPEVSVVIPTKNEEKSIGICIEKIQKVFNEHHIDGEIIVADNSTDNTAEIAKGMGAKVIVQDLKKNDNRTQMNADSHDFKFRIRFNRRRSLLEVEFITNWVGK